MGRERRWLLALFVSTQVSVASVGLTARPLQARTAQGRTLLPRSLGELMQDGDELGNRTSTRLTGVFKADGDKMTFMADEDHKTWDVMNPEVSKGNIGRHVEITARVSADKGSLRVLSVKKVK